MKKLGIGVQLDVAYTLRVAKLLADPLRIKIVMELNMRPMSPKEFFEKFGGGSLSRVSRHFDLLVEYGWLYLEKIETGGRRRGAVEHFYRALEPAVFHDDLWEPLPQTLKEMVSGGIFEEFSARVREAMEAGTFDARETRHFSWSPFMFDEQGWNNSLDKVNGLFHWFLEEQKRANERMAESGEEPIPMTVALAAFESPKDTEKQP